MEQLDLQQLAEREHAAALAEYLAALTAVADGVGDTSPGGPGRDIQCAEELTGAGSP